MALTCFIRFDPAITGDGLLTLAGGVLAFCAVLWQTSHADKGLQRQIDEVRRREDKHAQEVVRSTATGILSEIDWFYRGQLATCLISLRKFDPQKGLRMLPPLRLNPFPDLGYEFAFPAVGIAHDRDVTGESRKNLKLLFQSVKPLDPE